jgi:hypothetical protein
MYFVLGRGYGNKGALQHLRGDAEELWDPPPQLGGVESMSLLWFKEASIL